MGIRSLLAAASLIGGLGNSVAFRGEWRSVYQNKPLSKREAKLQEKNRLRRERSAKRK